MRTLEALQRDMDITADLQEIVRTMKVLAAVSIHQYERAQKSLLDYNWTVELGLQAVLRQQDLVNHKRKPKTKSRVGAVIFGSDHGLCGRYNENIAEFAVHELDKINQDKNLRHILVVGNRIEAHLSEMGQTVEKSYFVPATVDNITGTVQELLLIIERWLDQNIEQTLLFHHQRQQGVSYTPQIQQLFPVNFSHYKRAQIKPWPGRTPPQFTQPTEKLLSSLVRQHLFIKLFSACTESLAGEHSSRLMSMQVAEKNIQQRQQTLTAVYRQQRQEQITEELLDVVSGFEALKNS